MAIIGLFELQCNTYARQHTHTHTGSVLMTHGCSFTPIYLEQWHEMITEMSHPHCLKEDRRFSFSVIADVLEFGLTTATAPSYFARYNGLHSEVIMFF